MDEATRRYVAAHLQDDVGQLALRGCNDVEVDLRQALQQIAGWQTARRKLPTWAQTEEMEYPPHLAMEQCSSEETARYKEKLARRLTQGCADATMMDITGGFGVDFAFMARAFKKAIYVERQEQLCATARHNFGKLGLAQATVFCADGVEMLRKSDGVDLLYADPARRDGHGRKTYAVGDCTPDVLLLRDELLEKARWVVLKLSPMLDWHKAAADFGTCVSEVHIVAAGGECKEMLLVLTEGHEAAPMVWCVCDGHQFGFRATDELTTAGADPGVTAELPHPGHYLYEPNAALMKAGCFGLLGSKTGTTALSANSHLFLSDRLLPQFPGRRFQIEDVCTMNKKELRRTLGRLKQANIAVRNFPLSAVELRRRLKLSDGGTSYLFGTTLADGSHVVVRCTQIWEEALGGKKEETENNL